MSAQMPCGDPPDLRGFMLGSGVSWPPNFTAAQQVPPSVAPMTWPFGIASSPPADFWDRVAREVARLMVQQQGALAVGPATSSTLEHG